MEGFSDALRREMRPWGIRVSIITPGTFKTGILDAESHIVTCHKHWDSLNDEVKEGYGEQFLQSSKTLDSFLFAIYNIYKQIVFVSFQDKITSCDFVLPTLDLNTAAE